MKRYTIIDAVGPGFLVISLENGECLGRFATRYAANKARKSA
jgi:hypothetical protein